MRRKGETPVPPSHLYWSDTCHIARMILTGDPWLHAWVVQQRGRKRDGKKWMTGERFAELYYHDMPTDEEVADLAVYFRTDVASMRASIDLDGYNRSGCDPDMCNLYNIKVTRLDINEHFRAKDDWRKDVVVQKDYVAPGKPGYIVREEDGNRMLSAMLWGFPFQGKAVTNVRNYTSPFWKSALANPARRCLVPVTEFQEWSVHPMSETGKKKPFWFGIPSQPIFAFAGIWRPTEAAPVFSFLTCGYDGDPATHAVGAIHPKACPVILHEEDYDTWLHADVEDALHLASPFPSQLIAVRG